MDNTQTQTTAPTTASTTSTPVAPASGQQLQTPAQFGVSLDFSKAQPITNPSDTQSNSDGSSGPVRLDFSKSQPLNLAPLAAVPDSLHIDPDGNPLLNVAKGVNSFGAGIGDGLLTTLNGGANLLHLPHATLQARQQQLESQNRENPLLNTSGKLSEDAVEFLGGDEALKALSLSDRLLKISRIAKVLENSPLAMRAFNIGANMLKAGGIQSGITAVKTGDPAKIGKSSAYAAGGAGVLGVGGEALSAIRSALDPNAIQAPLQAGIRNILSTVADDTGVAKPTASSIRDSVQQVADGLKAKAQGLYQTLDNISGGAAQRFRDAAQNVSDKLSEVTGLDDEQEARLIAQQAKIEAAHKAMLDELEAKGYDRNMLAQADAAWKKQSALTDLSNALRQSTSGLRPELADGVNGATTPESVNPKTLFTKVNRLNDRGRLAQAIGQDNADALLQHIDSAYVQAQKIVARNKFAGFLARTAGLGSAGAAGVHFAHEMLGGGQ